ncbi:hypothetical protein GF312_01915 [Candidatus Poribacteria bacterium]|nr:hypothetical protein [Candidatus Poribacteria bacterium]
MGKYLIVGDVDHIQDYVFGSTRLRSIRGASAFLDIVAEKVKLSPPLPLESKDILRWRGGQIVALLKNGTEAQAEAICAYIEDTYRRLSAGEASITMKYEPYDNFSDSIANVFRKIQNEKDERQTFGSYGEGWLTSSYDHRCEFIPSLSSACHIPIGQKPDIARKYMSRAALKRWNIVTSGSEIPSDRDLKCKFSAEGIKTGIIPYKPEDLWSNDSDERYMAFVMADGNGFGQLLQSIPNEDLYRAYSQELHQLVLSSIVMASEMSGITTFLSKSLKGDTLPLIPIILGGDDMSFLIRDEHAVGFAYHLCNSFWKLSDNKSSDGISYKYPAIQEVINHFICNNREMGKLLFPNNLRRLTLSTGIAIAKINFPISLFRRTAKELEESAKAKIRSEPNYILEGGAIDFAVITTSTVQPLDDIRKQYTFVDEFADTFSGHTLLTQRPYTVKQFGKLQQLSEAFKNIPRSKRKLLYQEFFKGKARATETYQFVMSREKENKEKLDDILRDQFNYERGNDTPFHKDIRDDKTPILDALELAELNPEE